MDYYHIWCNLKDGSQEHLFTENLHTYLGHLRDRGAIAGFRLARKKLGLAPAHLGEFHIVIEVRDLAQLEEAFQVVGVRREPVEPLHRAVNQMVRDVQFALYRDYPDAFPETGENQTPT